MSDQPEQYDALDAIGNPSDLEGLANLARLEQAIEEQGEENIDPHLVLDAAADISSVVGDQLEDAMFVLQAATQNFIAMMALMNKYHEMAYSGQEGDAQ